MTADFRDQLSVMRSLNDQRVGLNGDQVIGVAEMNHEQRIELLTEIVEQAHAAALVEDRIRNEKESQ